MGSRFLGIERDRRVVARSCMILAVAALAALFFGLAACASDPVEDAGVEDIVLEERDIEDVIYDAVCPDEAFLDLVGASLPAYRYTDNIEVVYQYPTYPSGCETAALTCVLNSMGYDVTLAQMIEGDYVSYDSSWAGTASEVYFGTPYGQGGAFPPAVVAAANRFLDEQVAQVQAEEHVVIQGDDQTYVESKEHEGRALSAQASSDVRAEELEAASPDELTSLVERGYPVMVWVTVSYDAPAFSGEVIDGYRWYTNEHCVVLYGYDQAADEVLISDSVCGYVNMPAREFFDLFAACGSYAAVIR